MLFILLAFSAVTADPAQFEEPIQRIRRQIEELSAMDDQPARQAEIAELQRKLTKVSSEIYSKLTPWQKTLVARHPQRPYTLDYLSFLFDDFTEMHGDRKFSDDPAIVAGFASFRGQPCAVVGHQKGRNTKEKVIRNFGQPRPEGFRKALRVMEMAQKFHRPIVVFIDTPGIFKPRRRLETRQVSRLTGELAENAYEVLAVSSLTADREVARLRGDAESVQRQLILLVMFGTAVALTIALALSRYISRPITQLDDSIRQLGGADFSRPIVVQGPEDLQTLGERLDWLRRRLAELEAEKNRFLRHLSHELKTPLTALREGAELLHDQVAGPLAPPQRQVVSIMRDNSIKLQRLIEELLDYQRALHAAASLEVKPVVLDALVAEAVRAHELAAQSKGLRLAIEAQPATLEADPEKLRSILDNLIGNAVKFTPTGGLISVVLRASGEEAEIDVIDSGPGVPEEEREGVDSYTGAWGTRAAPAVTGSSASRGSIFASPAHLSTSGSRSSRPVAPGALKSRPVSICDSFDVV